MQNSSYHHHSSFTISLHTDRNNWKYATQWLEACRFLLFLLFYAYFTRKFANIVHFVRLYLMAKNLRFFNEKIRQPHFCHFSLLSAGRRGALFSMSPNCTELFFFGLQPCWSCVANFKLFFMFLNNKNGIFKFAPDFLILVTYWPGFCIKCTKYASKNVHRWQFDTNLFHNS